jgi:hypothetical protein
MGSSWERALAGGPSGGSLNSAVVAARDKYNTEPRDRTSTTPLGSSSSSPYSIVARPLSAEAVMAFGNRRLAADMAFQRAKEKESSGTQQYQLSFEFSKGRLGREYKSASSELARSLAGRGLARSPMLRGKGEIEIGRVADDNLGQIKLTIASEIDPLKQATEDARIEREQILAQIELDEALARSAARQYVTYGG